MAISHFSGVWHVGWWNLIASRLIQVGNNRNDHFRYFLGVRVPLIEVFLNKIKVLFKKIREINLGTSATVRLIEDVRLIQVSA